MDVNKYEKQTVSSVTRYECTLNTNKQIAVRDSFNRLVVCGILFNSCQGYFQVQNYLL